MLRRLTLRDVVIVSRLEVDLEAGFSVLTGETGAGQSILIDALQLALGGRGDAGLVREGCARAEVTAEFDAPAALAGWLDEAGFSADDDSDARLLLRRSIDAQGKSRAWINGSPATLSQLREAGEQLLDIHGQHAWQSLTRPAAVRALLDEQAGVDTRELSALWQAWNVCKAAASPWARKSSAAQRSTLRRSSATWEWCFRTTRCSRTWTWPAMWLLALRTCRQKSVRGGFLKSLSWWVCRQRASASRMSCQAGNSSG